jgi:hypothetical protein
MPAVPLEDAGRFVAAAYTVFVVLLVVYVGIMAAKLGRISRDLDSLIELAERRGEERDAPAAAPPPGQEEGAGATAVAGEERSR